MKWFNDPKEAARMKEPTRPILFSVHQLYFQKEWEKVVEKGLELLSIGVNETSEVIDLVLRAWQKTEGTIQSRKNDIVEVAKRWREYVSPGLLDSYTDELTHSGGCRSKLNLQSVTSLHKSSIPPILPRLALLLPQVHYNQKPSPHLSHLYG